MTKQGTVREKKSTENNANLANVRASRHDDAHGFIRCITLMPNRMSRSQLFLSHSQGVVK